MVVCCSVATMKNYLLVAGLPQSIRKVQDGSAFRNDQLSNAAAKEFSQRLRRGIMLQRIRHALRSVTCLFQIVLQDDCSTQPLRDKQLHEIA